MQLSVLVEPVNGKGFRAKGSNPFPLSASGSTRDEAIAKLRAKIQAKLKNGTELVALELGPEPHPWMEFAGMFKDDPYFEDVLKIMAENRKRMDADPDVL